MVQLSIITPCYNSGKFLLEMLESINKFHSNISYEVIIVNDGSTDQETFSILKQIEQDPNIRIIHQENKGASSARNIACKNANGQYFLFLDSDNKILDGFIKKATEKLQNNPDIDVVYGKPTFFGDSSRKPFYTGEFDINRLLVESYIDMCAIVRRSMWEKVGGLDESKDLPSLEDWEFFLNIYKHKGKFYFFDEKFYEYRISRTSITATVPNDKTETARKYIYNKHFSLFESGLRRLYYHNKILKESRDYRLGKLLLSPIRFLKKIKPVF